MKPVIYLHDDEPSLTHAIGRLLGLVARVETFNDAQAALDRIAEAPPDLFITDEYHPGMRGTEMVTTLRRTTIGRRLPIWIISGACNPDVALDAGANLALPKPIGSKQLSRHVERVLHLKKTELVDTDVETADLDYKERPDFSTKDAVAALAKDIIAIANFGGGHIIFGKRDLDGQGFETVGLTDDEIASLEKTRLNLAIAPYIESEHCVAPLLITSGGRKLVDVHVPAGTDVIFAAKQNDKASLFPGRIYIRTDLAQSTEATTSRQVRRILHRVRTPST